MNNVRLRPWRNEHDAPQSLIFLASTITPFLVPRTHTGNRILSDIMPDHVAETMRRKLLQQASASIRPISARSDEPDDFLLGSDNYLDPVTEGGGAGGGGEEGDQQLVFQQWHPAVSVLFAGWWGSVMLGRVVNLVVWQGLWLLMGPGTLVCMVH